MPDLPLSSIFAYAAKKAEAHPLFLSSSLASYCEMYSLSETELAEQLGISLDNLHLLALCKTPKNRQDIEQIAVHFNLAYEKLSEITGFAL